MVLQRKGLSFGSRDPTICEDGTKAILSALLELEVEGKLSKEPSLILLSTTGISDKRDIPVAMMPLYHWMLSMPHKDKKKMEDVMISGEGRRRKWVLVRPSLLIDGEAKGLREVEDFRECSWGGREDAREYCHWVCNSERGCWALDCGGVREPRCREVAWQDGHPDLLVTDSFFSFVSWIAQGWDQGVPIYLY